MNLVLTLPSSKLTKHFVEISSKEDGLESLTNSLEREITWRFIKIRFYMTALFEIFIKINFNTRKTNIDLVLRKLSNKRVTLSKT